MIEEYEAQWGSLQYMHLHQIDTILYSGTPLSWRLLDPTILSFIARCPQLRGYVFGCNYILLFFMAMFSLLCLLFTVEVKIFIQCSFVQLRQDYYSAAMQTYLWRKQSLYTLIAVSFNCYQQNLSSSAWRALLKLLHRGCSNTSSDSFVRYVVYQLIDRKNSSSHVSSSSL